MDSYACQSDVTCDEELSDSDTVILPGSYMAHMEVLGIAKRLKEIAPENDKLVNWN